MALSAWSRWKEANAPLARQFRNVFLLEAKTVPEDKLQSPQEWVQHDITSFTSSFCSGWKHRLPNLVHSSRSHFFGFLSHIPLDLWPSQTTFPTTHTCTFCATHFNA